MYRTDCTIAELIELFGNPEKQLFMSVGPNGCGKTLQGDLIQALRLGVAHISSSDSIRFHRSQDTPLGRALNGEGDREGNGKLFSDDISLQAFASDIVEGHRVQPEVHVSLLTGGPRGKRQPAILAEIPNAEFLVYEQDLILTLERTAERVEDMRARKEKLRAEDLDTNIIAQRWHDHQNDTVRFVENAASRFKRRLHRINSNHPVREVLRLSLKALGFNTLKIGMALHRFDNREGAIRKIMEPIDRRAAEKRKASIFHFGGTPAAVGLQRTHQFA